MMKCPGTRAIGRGRLSRRSRASRSRCRHHHRTSSGVKGAARAPAGDQTVQPNEGTTAARMGRPNTRAQVREKVEELWNNEAFQAIRRRDEQARKVRAQLCGEKYRNKDAKRNYNSSVIMRIRSSKPFEGSALGLSGSRSERFQNDTPLGRRHDHPSLSDLGF